VVTRLSSYRDLADYERTWRATAEILAAAFADAEPLLERACDLLRRGGWIPGAA